MEKQSTSTILANVLKHINERNEHIREHPTRAIAANVNAAKAVMPMSLPSDGMDLASLSDHLVNGVCPGLSPGQAGPRYFGFVTGGVTPAAQLADMLVTSYDANVQVHLPQDTIATNLEERTLEYLLDLLDLDRTLFPGKTFTTGATASNVLGICCGREHVMKSIRGPEFSVADEGLSGCKIRIFHADGHASVAKAASIAGVGRSNCVNLSESSDAPSFDLIKLESAIVGARKEGFGCIVVSSHGEVNTGEYTSQIADVREICTRHDAWLHIDAAFGAFAGKEQYLELADSITTDAHKWLNVPYDCGIFFTKHLNHLQATFSPTFALTSGPAYLLASADVTIPSPLTIGIENSRRFRALPVYASLLSLGKNGYRSLFDRNLAFARRVAAWIDAHPGYELVNKGKDDIVASNIVLFRASDAAPERFGGSSGDGAVRLATDINETRRMYVSSTRWKGRGAVRIAVSNWLTDLEGSDDFEIVKGVLEEVISNV
ncbi:hypothetical protein HDU97_006663 [Phlyctochytrium planicorne]|nr:hypothetical protein HDU97_006663 [Phlyctochytrium planicorne]